MRQSDTRSVAEADGQPRPVQIPRAITPLRLASPAMRVRPHRPASRKPKADCRAVKRRRGPQLAVTAGIRHINEPEIGDGPGVARLRRGRATQSTSRVTTRSIMARRLRLLTSHPPGLRLSCRYVELDLYFTDYFEVEPTVLEDYGAFDISVWSRICRCSSTHSCSSMAAIPSHQQLHQQILDYLLFLRDRAAEEDLDPRLIDTLVPVQGGQTELARLHSVQATKAQASIEYRQVRLHSALGEIFADFGNETVTRGTHLEKLCLIREGVGRDNISDFTTNLIKGFLCEYTQTFARERIFPEYCQEFAVRRARFDYGTAHMGDSETYYLPSLRGDFVLLTPMDILTRDGHLDQSHRHGLDLLAASPKQCPTPNSGRASTNTSCVS